MRDYGLSAYDADVLVAERETRRLSSRGRRRAATPSWRRTGSSTNWPAGSTRKAGTSPTSPVSAAQLGAILDLIAEGTISGKIAKDLFEIVWTEGGDPRAIVETRGMKQVTDIGAIESGGRRDHRRQSRQGRRREGEAEGARLVRRPGDEGVRRQGQPAGGERAAQGQAWQSDKRQRAGDGRRLHMRSRRRIPLVFGVRRPSSVVADAKSLRADSSE